MYLKWVTAIFETVLRYIEKKKKRTIWNFSRREREKEKKGENKFPNKVHSDILIFVPPFLKIFVKIRRHVKHYQRKNFGTFRVRKRKKEKKTSKKLAFRRERIFYTDHRDPKKDEKKIKRTKFPYPIILGGRDWLFLSLKNNFVKIYIAFPFEVTRNNRKTRKAKVFTVFVT